MNPEKINPQQLVMNLIRTNSNPIVANLMELAQKGDQTGIEKFARNMCKERGRDFDKEFAQFMQQFNR